MPLGAATNWPVAGSHTCSEPGAALNASHATTLPLDSIDVCTATIGQSCGGVQVPTWSAPGGGGGGGGGGVLVPLTGVFMSLVISLADSARSYTRTSSMAPLNHSDQIELPPMSSEPPPVIEPPPAVVATAVPLT